MKYLGTMAVMFDNRDEDEVFRTMAVMFDNRDEDEVFRMMAVMFDNLTRFNKICHPSQRPRWQVDKEAIGLSRVQQCSSTYSPPS